MSTTWNVQWLNENSQRAYPLRYGLSATDITGTITIPDELIVNMQIALWGGGFGNLNIENFFIYKIGILGSAYQITIAYNQEGTVIEIGSVNFPASGEDFKTYKLAGNDSSVTGHITIGRTLTLSQQPPGIYTFEAVNTYLEADVVRPTLSGLVEVTIANGDTVTKVKPGLLVLSPGQDMRFAKDTTDLSGFNREWYVISAVLDNRYAPKCPCPTDGTPSVLDRKPIYKINFASPDENGNIKIGGTKCVVVTAETGQITIHNPCAEPCCGCSELAVLNEQIIDLSENAAQVNAFSQALDATANSFFQKVMTSKLVGDGCVDCVEPTP